MPISKYYIKCEADVKEEYMEIVENYIKYYASRAKECKMFYYAANIIKTVALALIPVLQLVPFVTDRPWITVVISAIGIIAEALVVLFRYRDKWHLYRDANNVLMSEQRKYCCDIGEYQEETDEEKKWKLFVQRVEDIVDTEAKKWSMKMTEKAENQQQDKQPK